MNDVRLLFLYPYIIMSYLKVILLEKMGDFKTFMKKNENKNSPQITQINTDYKNKENPCKSV